MILNSNEGSKWFWGVIKYFCIIRIHIMALIHVESQNLLIKQCNLKENLELSGTIKVPSHMATWLSPNGSAKKHSLYNKHPSACEENRNGVEKDLNQVNFQGWTLLEIFNAGANTWVLVTKIQLKISKERKNKQ